ncbi:hypothetical protein Tco_0619032, partial [Tanacetum coccineum]
FSDKSFVLYHRALEAEAFELRRVSLALTLP